MRRVATVAAALACGLVLPVPAAAQGSNCFGETDANQVEQRPGPNLRFGITPGVQTGQLARAPSRPGPPRTPPGS